MAPTSFQKAKNNRQRRPKSQDARTKVPGLEDNSATQTLGSNPAARPPDPAYPSMCHGSQALSLGTSRRSYLRAFVSDSTLFGLDGCDCGSGGGKYR